MSNYNKEYIVSGVTARLFDIIQSMSEDEQENLLSKFSMSRKSFRNQYMMLIEYITKNGVFKSFITDISIDGVFIETINLSNIGEEITLCFNLRRVKEPLKIIGEVIRIDSTGVGVQFKILSNEQREILDNFIKTIKN